MSKQQDRPGFALVVTFSCALITIAVSASFSKADAAETCASPRAFITVLEKEGARSIAVPAANFPKAQKLLDITPNHAPIAADAAYFEEMPDKSSSLIFIAHDCVAAVWMTPPWLPVAKLKEALLDEYPVPETPA